MNLISETNSNRTLGLYSQSNFLKNVKQKTIYF